MYITFTGTDTVGPLVKFRHKSVGSEISLDFSSGKIPLVFSYALFANQMDKSISKIILERKRLVKTVSRIS